MGQRGLLPEQRLRKQGGLAHGQEHRAARRPGRRFLPPRAVRAVPQSGLSHLATRRRPGHVRRPRQHPAAGRAPVAHRHAAPVPASRRLGGRPLRGRPRQRVRGSAGLRAPDGAGADARSRSRVTRVVPGRRVPPRDRGAVDAAHRVHVGAPVAAARALDRAGDRVGADPHAGRRLRQARAAAGIRSRRPDRLARRPLAQRRGQLPLRLPAAYLHRPPYVLARTHPQPGAARCRLPDRHGPVAPAGGPAGRVPPAARLGALHRADRTALPL